MTTIRLPAVCAPLNLAATVVCGVCGTAEPTCTKPGVAVTADSATVTVSRPLVHPATVETKSRRDRNPRALNTCAVRRTDRIVSPKVVVCVTHGRGTNERCLPRPTPARCSTHL